ncbi:unnamed protein product [Arabidopsis lyrata]|uniref:Uncharacterized protein n=1 Tax=Arabidopsis lyrata subsp. lyrata TaxID=81972 RepID=D7KMP5_ARALL|nr:protein RALF-like 2 [Arabidopsis lyrata subsp. lyrata]EFH66823.1 hypothetical protein ARALYDRAFT_472570 [Arabidopsis lyrata subsp. lyrata]CAH8253292.1 unnamed protein product [Arabidopsis lyrata]|eukprot:XP_020869967.1 protein RALF-like 2 [Arabidopsis lyrata subsp. lyrata]
MEAIRPMLVAILVLSCVFMNIMKVEAQKEIGYPAIGRDGAHGCSPKYPSVPCRPKQPENPYKRGCEKITRCKRDGDGDKQAALLNPQKVLDVVAVMTKAKQLF